MKRANVPVLFGLLLAGAGLMSACGFDCQVQGETQHFAACEDLQAAFDAEQSRLNPPPDNAVLDDLDTCGEINNCEVQP